MAPPDVPVAQDVGEGNPPPVPFCVEVLQRRSDFLRAAKAKHKRLPGMMLQARHRADGDTVLRVGFTCSKKVGNAVARNRAKRRLREVARLVLPEAGLPGWDYVLIGRAGTTATRPFNLLLQDFRDGLRELHPDGAT